MVLMPQEFSMFAQKTSTNIHVQLFLPMMYEDFKIVKEDQFVVLYKQYISILLALGTLKIADLLNIDD